MVDGPTRLRLEWHIAKAREMIIKSKINPDFKMSYLMSAKSHVDKAEQAYNDLTSAFKDVSLEWLIGKESEESGLECLGI